VTGKASAFLVACCGELQLDMQILLSWDLGYLNKESLLELQRNIVGIDNMLKAEDKFIRKQTLEPLNPGSLTPLNYPLCETFIID